MGKLEGSSSAEIDAPLEKVWKAVEDVESAPDWQGGMKDKGDLKSMDGSWELEDLGDDRTRATYWLAGDTGRVLGMVIRGPVEDRLRDMLVNARADELKAYVEGR